MKRLAWILMIAMAPTLAAQEPGDSGPGAVPPAAGEEGGAQAEQLRQRIRQRWNEHVRTTLGLNDDQTAKLQGTEQRFEGQRQPIRVRQREINRALNGELAAGAPNQDREMQGFLSPVQRARYQEERRRFQERVAEVVRHRREVRRQMPGTGGRGGPRGRVR